MTALSLAIGTAGNVTGLLVYASPMPTFWRVIKKKSTEAFSGIPYAFALLSALQWMYFGVLRGPNARPLLSLTVIGFLLQAGFNLVYLLFASKSGRVLQARILGLILAFYAAMLTLTMTLLAGDVRSSVVGIFCAVISICYSASPFLIVKRVIKTRSVEFMPFYMTLFMFLNAATWLAFAFLTKDIDIAIPNCVNIVLGGIQLTLYCYYKLVFAASMQPRKENAATVNDDLSTTENDACQALQIVLKDLGQSEYACQASEIITDEYLVKSDVPQASEIIIAAADDTICSCTGISDHESPEKPVIITSSI